MKKAKNGLGILAIICLCIAIFLVYSRCREEDLSKQHNESNAKVRATKAKSQSEAEKECSKISTISVKEELDLEPALILILTINRDSYQNAVKTITEMGGRITAGLPPEAFYALVPKSKMKELNAFKEFVVVLNQRNADSIPGLNEIQKNLLEKWNRKLTNTQEPSLIPNPPPPPNDALQRPPFEEENIEEKPPKSFPRGTSSDDLFILPEAFQEIAPGPTTSMSGKVLFCIFFPESNGVIDRNQENWTSTQVYNVLSEVLNGVNWWAIKAPGGANLSFEGFYFDPSDRCMQTSYEPITRPQTDEGLWINEIMTCLGYTSGSYITKVDSFNTWLKSTYGGAEAYSIFVVDDDVDSDNMFADGLFAYAYLGGPLEVMTYANDGYGIENMDAVHAHETGHIFGAFDEYASASTCVCTNAHNNCPNQNCENSCLFDVPCIMRGQISPFTNNSLCDCTKGQVGWSCGSCSGQSCPCSNLPNCCFTDSLSITSGNSINQSLTTSDATDAGGHYFDDIEFCGTSGQTVTIDMYSADFDTYLELYPPSSCTTAATSDDDSGYNTNSRIVFTLTQTGTWTIKARSFSAGVTGSYTVWLNGPPGCLNDNDSACNDSNVCTTDTCQNPGGYPYSTCSHSNNTNPCSDGLWCNGNDTCSGGTCSVHQYNGNARCDDGNVCTTDSCNESTDSCNYSPNSNPCDDGQWCNGTDTCSGGTCSVHQYSGNARCDDGQYCNGSETCNESTDSCQAGIPVNCSDGQYCNGTETCNESTDSCQAGTPVTCDDGNVCTTDSCNESTDSCDYIPNSNPCDDGQWCNGTDTCNAGICVHSGDPCSGATPYCNEDYDKCDGCKYTVIKPNGGNRWKAERRYKILWSKEGTTCDSYVKIQYSTDGGKRWRKVTKQTPNDGLKRWKVPDRETRKAKIKVCDYADQTICDTSDKNFKIISASLNTSFSSAPVEVGPEETEQKVSDLVADEPDGEDLSPEQLAAEDEEGEGRFGCMMTSGNADSGRIWSMLIYGLPVVVALYFRRRRKAQKITL